LANLLGIILLQFARDWDKTREINLLQFARDWDKTRENIFFEFHTDWDKIFSNVKYNNYSSSFCNKCSPYAPPFFLLFPHYFTDHLAVNLIIIKYLFINGGS